MATDMFDECISHFAIPLATKVRTSDIGEHTFRDDNGASFHLPADVATRKSCEEGDTVCGMNIVVETWDNEVLGDGIAGPGRFDRKFYRMFYQMF